MPQKNYRPRVSDALLQEMLESSGAVLIEGAKWCGKTTSAERIANTVIKLDDPARQEQNLLMARTSPGRLLMATCAEIVGRSTL